MTPKELIELANTFYSDGVLTAYITEDGEFYDNPKGGDTLARFIVSELLESVDFDQPEEAILREARECMHRAMDDICSVLAGLDGLVVWRETDSRG